MYFGSVRFYKNLILLVVIILIVVPTVLAICFGVRLGAQKEETEALRGALAEAGGQLPADYSPPAGDGLLAEDPGQTENGGYTADTAPEGLEYQSLFPDFYAPSPYHATERTEKMIYLTFDDGPSSNTSAILQVLAEEGVEATFFVTGQKDETGFQRMRDIVNAGHTIGMHSFTHNYTTIYSSVEAFLEDMYACFLQIREATGVTPTLFRFPGGSINSYNAGFYQELVAEMVRRGFVPCDWNLSAEDSVRVSPSVEQITRGIVDKARDRDVVRGFVLMHDSRHTVTTLQALPGVIQGLRELGYEFARMTPDTKPVLFTYKE